jgi:putative hemolysin
MKRTFSSATLGPLVMALVLAGCSTLATPEAPQIATPAARSKPHRPKTHNGSPPRRKTRNCAATGGQRLAIRD